VQQLNVLGAPSPKADDQRSTLAQMMFDRRMEHMRAVATQALTNMGRTGAHEPVRQMTAAEEILSIG
jgi:hypothetical protein